jgi:spatacsin
LESVCDRLDAPLLVEAASVFPVPSLILRLFYALVQQRKVELLPHSKLSRKVGHAILNCARHCENFVPAEYLEIALRYGLLRDYAELQLSCGAQLLVGTPDVEQLQLASKHYLLALAYFLHEKCYSLSMQCLRKLSLVSLQLEFQTTPLLHLEREQVLGLMGEKDFPFALTIAVAYDMDAEGNWVEAIWTHSIAQKGDEFLTDFQYFRPITGNLCEGIVRKYRATGGKDPEQRERMKQFLDCIPNLVERYRITKALEFQDRIDQLKKSNPVVCEWCERVLTGKT